MGCYGSPTPKRHSVWSNDDFIQTLVDRAGYLPKATRESSCKGKPLVDKYTDSKGVKRVKGNKNLKASQFEPCLLDSLCAIVCAVLASQHSCSSNVRSLEYYSIVCLINIYDNAIYDTFGILLDCCNDSSIYLFYL